MGFTPEGLVKRDIRAYLDELGAYTFMPVQTGYGQKTLDFLCCVGGRFVAIEAKAPGKDATKFQVLTMTSIGASGGLVLVARSVEDVRQAFAEAGIR